ncbi:MAG: hypothetical protein AB8G99_11780 [Planctomycetaceae bacterium]
MRKLLRRSNRRAKKTVQAEELETRTLLTGTVRVGLKGDTLTIRGNNQDNVIQINAGAEDVEDLIQGEDGTRIKFARKLVRAVERGGAEDISAVDISMRGGNDVVLIDGNGEGIFGDLNVDLGDGGDTFVAVDGFIEGDVTIENPDASSYIALANIEIEGDLSFVGSRSSEVFAMCDVFVDGDVDISMKKGHDTVLITTSEISDDLRVSLGRGQDLLGIVDTFVGDDTDVFGYTGDDGALFQDNDWDMPTTDSIETIYTDANDVPDDIVDAATAKVEDLLEDLDDSDLDVPPTLEDAAIKLNEIFNGEEEEDDMDLA